MSQSSCMAIDLLDFWTDRSWLMRAERAPAPLPSRPAGRTTAGRRLSMGAASGTAAAAAARRGASGTRGVKTIATGGATATEAASGYHRGFCTPAEHLLLDTTSGSTMVLVCLLCKSCRQIKFSGHRLCNANRGSRYDERDRDGRRRGQSPVDGRSRMPPPPPPMSMPDAPEQYHVRTRPHIIHP